MKRPRVRWGAVLAVVDRMAVRWLTLRGWALAPPPDETL